MNRLQHENSPYLLQHAENPVDWYAWGPEAFEKARDEDKPIFLSIGYATCHWCHVMAHESFEDAEVAELLNDNFISIKVDREERPDIDQLYMTVCQMITGAGGWPLTIFMTPEREPFYATTYVPKEGRFGQPGLKQLLNRISQLWNEQRDRVLNSAEEIVGNLKKAEEIGPGEAPALEDLEGATEELKQQYDPEHGGFIKAPKFPSPHNLLFLLRRWHRSGDDELLDIVSHTLTAMRLGGLYDHVGFGFHRYSTDVEWHLPHFEKMLYDQAMLLLAYSEAWQITGKPLFQKTSEEITEYIFDQLTDQSGGFYSAEDADSEGEEGKFYVWTIDEVRDLLPAAQAELVIECYQLDEEGNFEDEATKQKTGANVLHLADTPQKLAEERDMSTDQLNDLLEQARQKLLEARSERPRPFKDDKILTDWDGLMIAALAKAGFIFNREDWSRAAARAATFIENNLVHDGKLLHRYRNGEAAVPALADDYATYIFGLIELYQTTHNPDWLEKAIKWQEIFIEQCMDEERGGFYQNSKQSEELPSRSREAYDGAYPSANSLAMNNLLRLSRLTGRTDWEDHADQLARAFGDMIKQAPTAFTHLLQGIDFALEGSSELLLAYPEAPNKDDVLLKVVRDHYLPATVLHPKTPKNSQQLKDLAGWTSSMQARDNQPTAYLCHNFTCEQPVTDPAKLEDMLISSK